MTDYKLSGRRLAILFDPKKPECRKMLDKCIRLKDYLSDKNVEYWSGGTKSSHEEMSRVIRELKENGFGPVVCFPSLPQHAYSAKKADVLFRPYLVNTSGPKGVTANFLVFFGRVISNYILSKGDYPSGFEIRDTLYQILDGTTSVGRFTGARTLNDDSIAIKMFENERQKHRNAHAYLEVGSGAKRSIDTWELLIRYVDQVLPEDRTIHTGGGIIKLKQIESVLNNVSRENLVVVGGNLFEREPEKIEDFAALFSK
jgi:heptaprenylglyceryl phosphate synthase